LPPTLGLGTRGAGAVVLIEGVARPLVPMLGRAAGMLGPREWRGSRGWCNAGRGVAAESLVVEVFRIGMGVEGIGRLETGASERGGDGGVTSGRRAPALVCGGVEAAVGEDKVVADVDASEAGERGRNESPAR